MKRRNFFGAVAGFILAPFGIVSRADAKEKHRWFCDTIYDTQGS